MRAIEFINEAEGQVSYKVAAPTGYSPQEMRAIIALIKSGGQNIPNGLEERVRRSKLIGVAIAANKIVGVGAIKSPGESYKDYIFSDAGVEELASKYKYEMGWKIVHPSYRGQNIGQTISEKLLAAVNKSKVYATVRAGNTYSLEPLARMGFKRVGTPFTGASGNQILLLVG